MITHEEARKNTLYLLGKYDEVFIKLNDYISQQEKVTDLLDLYRLLVEFTEKYNTQIRLLDRQESLDTIRELGEEIYLKEKELGEMK